MPGDMARHGSNLPDSSPIRHHLAELNRSSREQPEPYDHQRDTTHHPNHGTDPGLIGGVDEIVGRAAKQKKPIPPVKTRFRAPVHERTVSRVGAPEENSSHHAQQKQRESRSASGAESAHRFVVRASARDVRRSDGLKPALRTFILPACCRRARRCSRRSSTRRWRWFRCSRNT